MCIFQANVEECLVVVKMFHMEVQSRGGPYMFVKRDFPQLLLFKMFKLFLTEPAHPWGKMRQLPQATGSTEAADPNVGSLFPFPTIPDVDLHSSLFPLAGRRGRHFVVVRLRCQNILGQPWNALTSMHLLMNKGAQNYTARLFQRNKWGFRSA